jgi:phosphoglucosamine mutase
VKKTADKKGLWKKNDDVLTAISECEENLGSNGRVLVRESGTEPLVRVMLEGKNIEEITEYANGIAALIKEM